MTAATLVPPIDSQSKSTVASQPVVQLKRRSIDAVLIGFGAVALAVFAVAGGLLSWGTNFSDDYVTKELSSQNITFPTAEALTKEGRTDLLEFAGHRLDTGAEAEAYASYINGHLQGVADGATYADLGATENAAKAAVTAAVAAGQPQAQVDALQAKADVITGQRNTLFKGETLRGLLLTAFAWSTVGSIAGYAAIGAYIAAAIMAVLVTLGVIHHRRTPKTA
ncbi:MAG: hypothetical protein JWL72_1104 [Ilumatobacteraceae bacterium]|nr:hypothetical protein [Ilumatobacteraceae bacterium]